MESIKPGKQRRELYNAPLHKKRNFISAHLEEKLLLKYDKRAIPVVKGDTVKVMRGAFRGHEDKVAKVIVKKRHLEIEGLMMAKADGNKIAKPIHPSNVMITKLNLTDKWRRRKLERGLSEETKKEIEAEAKEQIKEVEEEKKKEAELKAKEEAAKELEEEAAEEEEIVEEEIAEEKFADALKTMYDMVPFPGTLGWVCNQPCEDTCQRAELDDPVSIRAMKKLAFEKSTVKIKKKDLQSGKKVAVIGSGPAGLSCAFYLTLWGHKVTIYEAKRKSGGMLRYGIPDFRLPRNVFEKEIEIIQKTGVDIKLNTRIKSTDNLFKQGFNAVFVGIGAQIGQKMNILNRFKLYAKTSAKVYYS